MSETRTVGPDDAYFWEGAAQDRLLIQRCTECSMLRHPPTPMCGECGALVWDTVEVSGRGRVYSWMFSKHPNRPDDPPRVVILVQLDEGVRLVSNLVDPPHGGPYDDLAVEVEFRDDRGTRTPFFRVTGPTGAAG